MNYAKFFRMAQKLQPPVRSISRRESGQAALFALLLIPTAIVATLLVFNTGQITANKLRVQNAADAAAFSAMELQARQMNLDAYLNRAMLANEVAIGQAVSILSWSRYAYRAGDNIQEVLGKIKDVSKFIPYVGSVIASAIQAWQQVIKTSSKAVGDPNYGAGVLYAKAFLPLANNMDAAYAGAQQAFNLTLGVSTPRGAVQETVNQMVDLNAPGAEVIAYPATALEYWAERRNFVTTWGGHANPKDGDPGGRTRMASMINQGMQPFTANRDHGFGSPSLLDISLYVAGIESHKYGGTQLAQGKDGNYIWSAADTVHTWVWYRRYGIFGGKKTIYNKSWGWGGAWSLPRPAGPSEFVYYHSDLLRRQGWKDAYVEPQAIDKSVQWPSKPVYVGAWSDQDGIDKVVRDDRDRVSTDTTIDPLGVGRGAIRQAQRGIAEYRDLAWKKRMDKQGDMADTAPKFIVLVSLPTKKVKDSVTALGISADPTDGGKKPSLGWMGMRLDTNGAGRGGNEGVRAAAAAQVYFRRPDALWPRGDGLDERANLFSPFWSTRLVDLSAAEKTSILAISSQS